MIQAVIMVLVGCLIGVLSSWGGWRLSLPLILLILLTAIEFLRPRRPEVPWDYMRITYIMFVLLYVFIPIHSLNFSEEIRLSVDHDFSEVLLANIYVLFAYLSMLAGYRLFGGSTPVTIRPDPVPPDLLGKMVGAGFFLFGLASFYGYAQIYGGIATLFAKADLIRSGYIGKSGMVFLRHLLPFANLGLWILLFWLHEAKWRIWAKLSVSLLLIAIVLPCAMATAGRLDVLFIFLPILIAPYFLRRRNPPWQISIALGALVGVWVLFGDMIFEYLSYGVYPEFKIGSKQYFGLINQFVHPFESLLMAMASVPHEAALRGFSDIWEAIVSLLPEKLLMLNLAGADFVGETVSTRNTFLLINVLKGIIPPGLLGYFYYCLMAPGILAGSFLFGLLLARSEVFFFRMMAKDRFFAVLYVAFGLMFAHCIIAGDPEVIMQGYFWLFSGSVCLLVLHHLQRLSHPFECKGDRISADREWS